MIAIVQRVSRADVSVAAGEFGVEMQVSLVNDRPVTISITLHA